jgi:hypothetical protein
MLTTFVLLAAIALGTEQPLSPPAYAPPPFEQRVAGAASNGNDFLAAWLDYRASVPSQYTGYGAARLYVTRVDAAGQPLAPLGTEIRDGVTAAALVHTGNGYRLLWSDLKTTSVQPLTDDGQPTGNAVALGSGTIAAAASNGLTLFTIRYLGSDTYIASIGLNDGTPLVLTSLGPEDKFSPSSIRALALPDGSYAVVSQHWTCPGNVACTVDASLLTFTTAGGMTRQTLGPLSQWSQVSAAVGGDRLLVTSFQDINAQQASRRVSFRVFDLAGNPASAETTLDETTQLASISGAWGAVAGWDGTDFLVAWQWPDASEATSQLLATRVTPSGVVLDPSPRTIAPATAHLPFFARSDSTQIVAWDDRRGGDPDAYDVTARTFRDLDFAAPRALTSSATLQRDVQLATLGSTTMAVWREGIVHASIIASTGNGAPIVIAPAAADADLEAPAIAASSDKFLIVWREQKFSAPNDGRKAMRILGKRMTADGVVLDRDPIVIASDDRDWFFQNNPANLAAASNGSDFLVVWPAAEDNLLGAHVASSGAVLDPQALVLSERKGTPYSPRVIWNGGQYLAAWLTDPTCKVCLISPIVAASELFTALVPASGAPSSPQLIWNGGSSAQVALARGAGGPLIAWPAVLTGSNAPCIDAMPLHDDGTPAGPARAGACNTSGSGLDAAADGTSFVLAWNESPRVRLARVSSEGVLLDGMADVPGTATFGPALASSPFGVVIAYDRIADEPQYGGVARVFLRTIAHEEAAPRRRSTR